MSHFSVLATLPGSTERAKLNDEIARLLAPFDENTKVEPHRDYQGGGPNDYWVVKNIRSMAEKYRAGEVPVPEEYQSETLAERTARHALAAELAPTLGDDPSWPAVLEVENKLYPGAAEDDDRKVYDPDKDQVYSMSTYNPLSKWDWWRVGGRWAGYFLAAETAEITDLIQPELDWDSRRDIGERGCDGGRKRALDLTGQRNKSTAKALARWDTYNAIVAGLPPLITWPTMRAKIEAGELTIDQARQQYHDQPRIVAVNAYSQTDRDWAWIEHEDFQTDREAYGLRAMQRAVPGYALLDGAVDGRWYAPGEMGWFGISSDNEQTFDAYAERVNQYVESLPEDTWVIALDCHI